VATYGGLVLLEQVCWQTVFLVLPGWLSRLGICQWLLRWDDQARRQLQGLLQVPPHTCYKYLAPKTSRDKHEGSLRRPRLPAGLKYKPIDAEVLPSNTPALSHRASVQNKGLRYRHSCSCPRLCGQCLCTCICIKPCRKLCKQGRGLRMLVVYAVQPPDTNIPGKESSYFGCLP